MTPETLNTLKTSQDAREVKLAAAEVAGSKVPADLDALHGFLTDPAFLLRLDDAEAYKGTFSRLRLGAVLQALMDNRIAASDNVLIRLTRSDVFLAEVLRMQLLIRALVPIRPSPPPAIAFWDSMSQPQSPIAFDVVEALVANQSPPAMDLLEKKFTNAREQPAEKITWMRQILLPKRNDEPLLGVWEKLVKAGQPTGAEVELVEALFDYDPKTWYRDCEPPVPPKKILATPAAKEHIRRIAEHALANMKLPPELEAKVKIGLQEVGGAKNTP